MRTPVATAALMLACLLPVCSFSQGLGDAAAAEARKRQPGGSSIATTPASKGPSAQSTPAKGISGSTARSAQATPAKGTSGSTGKAAASGEAKRPAATGLGAFAAEAARQRRARSKQAVSTSPELCAFSASRWYLGLLHLGLARQYGRREGVR